MLMQLSPRIDLIEYLLEWEKVPPLEHDVSASHLRTVVRLQLFYRRPVVVVEEKRVARVLLPIQRNSERNRLLDYIWHRRVALNVSGIKYGGSCCFCTEAASSITTEVFEVFTPNLNWSIAIFWTVSWIERVDVRLRVVYELCFVNGVTEVTNDRDLYRDRCRGGNRRCIVTLKTTISL